MRNTLSNIISDIEKFRIFSPCNDLYDAGSSSTSSIPAQAQCRRTPLRDFLRRGLNLRHSPSRGIPSLYYSAPRSRIDSNSPNSHISKISSHNSMAIITEQQRGLSLHNKNLKEACNIEDKMALYFRFFPEHVRFMAYEFQITEKVKKELKNISTSIGLLSNIVSFVHPDLFLYTRLGNGLRSLVTESQLRKVVIEVLTFYKGQYGRLVILTCLGVGCTIWYMFLPGVPDAAPPQITYPRVISYDSFLDLEYNLKPFHKLCYIERKYITGEVLSIYENVFPFSEINIPASTAEARIAIGLGVMIATFISLGFVPNVPSNQLINA